MLWFLVLHIIAVMFWCAAQLYLPALIAGMRREETRPAPALSTAGMPPAFSSRDADIPRSLPRLVFTRIATPAALLAIVSGTVIFLMNNTFEIWFIVKLGLVTALVTTHALTGGLLLRAEVWPERRVVLACRFLSGMLAVLMALIIWIVLAKPLPYGLE